jgi:hypothetical protein
MAVSKKVLVAAAIIAAAGAAWWAWPQGDDTPKRSDAASVAPADAQKPRPGKRAPRTRAPADETTAVAAPEPMPPAQGSAISDADYARSLDDLRIAVRKGDRAAVKALMALLVVPGVAKETMLQDLITKNDPDLCLHAGVLLGKLGDLKRTMEFIEAQNRKHGTPEAIGPNFGRLPDGRSNESNSIVTAVNLNTLRSLLERDHGDAEIQDVVRLATSEGLDEGVRMMMFKVLLDKGQDAGAAAVRRVLDTTQDTSVRSAVARAMSMSSVGATDPGTSTTLVDRYRESPAGDARAQLGVALAKQSPVDAALTFLRERAAEDLRVGKQSDAFAGIAALGERDGAFPLLVNAYRSEQNEMLRSAYLQAAVRSTDDGAAAFVLDVARRDASAYVRGQALSRLFSCVAPDVALSVLREALANERDDVARVSAISGFLNLAQRGGDTAGPALEAAAAGVCKYGHDNVWASMVPTLVSASANKTVRASVVGVFSRERPNIQDPVVAAAVAKVLSDNVEAGK